MADDVEDVVGAVHPPDDTGQRRAETIESGDERPDPVRGRLLEETEVAARHRSEEVGVHELLGVGALGEHEHRLAELQRLADQLVSGGGDQRPAADEVVDEEVRVLVLVDEALCRAAVGGTRGQMG